ncbi:MAG: hypothetical protein LV479_10135 [Methylacidiphilales bacterium]|nr:hypothetical protein [Candidatus Methylacidiphilales bacterium]
MLLSTNVRITGELLSIAQHYVEDPRFGCNPHSHNKPLLSPAQSASKKENQKDKQNESKATATYQRSAKVKSAAAEQEH